MVNKKIKILLSAIGALMLGFTSCDNEEVYPDNKPQYTVSEVEEIELPGYLGIRLSMRESTRADGDPVDATMDDKPADDNERALALSTEDEAYHYMLLYYDLKADGINPDNGTVNISEKPLLFRLDTQSLQEYDATGSEASASDIKLAVKKAYKSTEIKNNFKTEAQLQTFLNENLRVYVLLNFDKSLVDFLGDVAALQSKSTEEFLGNCTEEMLKSIIYKDYKITAKDSENKDAQYFTMTSAIYLKNGEATPAAIVNPRNIYYSEKTAIAGEPAIEARVERLAVKYSLNFGDKNTLTIKEGCNTIKTFSDISVAGDFTISTIEYNWELEVLGYDVNALEPSEYLMKNFSSNYSWASQPSSYRYIWGEDPHYEITGGDTGTKQHYPHQYRYALETDTIRAYLKNENSTYFEPYLTYKTFKSLTNKPTVFYSLENTYEDIEGFYEVSQAVKPEEYTEPGISGRQTESVDDETNTIYHHYMLPNGVGPLNYYTAGTHFIIACRAKVGNAPVGTDFYRDEDDLYFASKNQLLRAKLTILNDRDLVGGSSDLRVLNVDWGYNTDESHDYDKDLRIMDYPKGSRLYYKPNDGTIRAATYEDLDLIPAYITDGDGKVLIAPKESRIKNGQFLLVSSITGEQKEITPNQLISLFQKTMGVIDYFKGGMMYYCAPITHRVASPGKDSWITVGDFGAVRNNWYELIVTGVSSPGHSVADETYPIIPMLDLDRNYITSRVRVLRWHEISAAVTPMPVND